MRFPLFTELSEAVRDGFVNKVDHPELPYSIYNYTRVCQYERAWNEVTLQTRGLILDEGGEIVARGFNKFFNLEELSSPYVPYELPEDEGFVVLEKYDGSLGISYPDEAGYSIATRGSFTSEQSQVATEIYKEKYHDYSPPDGFTACFEIIYPENKIVVDYGNKRELIHLALIDNATGLPCGYDPDWPGPVAEAIDASSVEASLAALVSENQKNREGYVVRFDSGIQVKLKYEEYKQLHKIVTGLSTLSIWEALSDGRGISELLEAVPDEFHDFIRDTSDELNSSFAEIERQAQRDMEEARSKTDDRRSFALYVKEHKMPNTGLLFRMLDGHEYAHIIWKQVRPKHGFAYTSSVEVQEM